MPRQLPEHILVTLLQQCLVSSRCQASRTRLQHLTASTRSLHSNSSSQHLRGQTPPHKVPRRSFHSHNEVEYRPAIAAASEGGQNISSKTSERDEKNTQKEESYAVLGGGITGLVAAYHLTADFPNSKVTLFEKSDRLGGWLQSKHVDVGNGNIVFEQGPRTLRPHGPNALATLEIVCCLLVIYRNVTNWVIRLLNWDFKIK
jgi:oxygen-dependent protoporphyrinogen oxidase